MDLSCSLVSEQGRPLEGALAAAHDQDAPADELLESDQTTGMRPLIGRERPLHLFRDNPEARDTRGGDHNVGAKAATALERGFEAAAGFGEVLDQIGLGLDARLLLEPFGVLQEE